MRHDKAIFPYTKEMQKIERRFFDRTLPETCRRNTTKHINTKQDLFELRNSNKPEKLKVYLPWKECFVTLNKQTFNELSAMFENEKGKEDAAQAERMEKEAKKLRFSKVSNLKDGDTIVFRDRENPNIVGKVKIENGGISINGEERPEKHPFSFKNIRVVQQGENPQDYFLSDTVGLQLYHSEPNSPAGTTLGKEFEKLILGK